MRTASLEPTALEHAVLSALVVLIFLGERASSQLGRECLYAFSHFRAGRSRLKLFEGRFCVLGMLLSNGNVPFFMGTERSDELIPLLLKLAIGSVAFGPPR